MTSVAQSMVKTAADTANLRKELAAVQAKVAAFQRREQAEALLLELAASPENGEFAPVNIADFLEKRAQIEGLGPDEARRVVKLASRQSFDSGSIGEPHTPSSAAGHTSTTRGESKADDQLNDWLHSDA